MMKTLIGAVLVISAILGLSNIYSSYENRHWKGVGRFTIISNSKKVTVESIDPVRKTGVRLTLPDDVLVKTIQNRGEWKVSVLNELAEKYGNSWYGESISGLLGITYTTVDSDMTWWDKWEWFRLSKSIKLQELGFDSFEFLTESKALDGVKILGISTGWYPKIRELFYASDLANSQLEVRVINDTDVLGLANKFANKLESNGIRVLETKAGNDDLAIKCRVVSLKEFEKDPLINWIVDSFGCKWEGALNMEKIVDVYLGDKFKEFI